VSSYGYGVKVKMHYNEKDIDENLKLSINLSKTYLYNDFNIEHVLDIMRIQAQSQNLRWKKFSVSDFEHVNINEFKQSLQENDKFFGVAFLSNIPSIIEFKDKKNLGKIECHL
jgi:hypothetical protein